MKRSFVDLHHHSEHSVLDGLGSVTEHIQRAKELGHAAVAFTEHGTCRGFVALDVACKAEGVRPVYGCEVYVCRDHRRTTLADEQVAAVTAGLNATDAKAAKKALERVEGINERRHCVVLAETDEGLRNLIRLTNTANTAGFYYKPRVDLDLLEEYNEGLIVNSGCLGGVLARPYFAGDTGRMLDTLERLIDVFGDRFSLEIQPHPIEEQAEWNLVAWRLSREYGVPLVAANDSHYPSPDDWRVHDTMVCVGTKAEVADCDRLRYVSETFGLKSGEGMVEAFARSHPDLPRSVVLAAVERSVELAERCTAKLWKPSGVLLPRVTEREPDDELKDLCFDGWEWRDVPGRAARRGVLTSTYTERLAHELRVIKGMGFASYFLVVHEALNWARGEGIVTGPGRGSAAGSLVCYLLGITSLDPLEHGLLFERFLTPGRVDLPDIDCDIEDRRRQEVIEHLRDRYGRDCVAQISTVSRMRARSALKDVARAHGLPGGEVARVSGAIVEGLDRDDDERGVLEQALETTPALRAFADVHPEVMAHAIALEGSVRHVGIHPAGVVTSPFPLRDFIPLERRVNKGEEIVVTAYDMRECEAAGLVKLDVLGLSTLSVVSHAVHLIARRTGEHIDLEVLPFNDGLTLEAFTEQDFVGVFQFDTATSRSACDGVVFDAFEDVVALNALNRPGPAKSGLADLWRERKREGAWAPGHPIIEAICADTRGVIAYQEHIIRILQELAGYTPEEAGRLRKAISKSKGRGYLELERPVFVEGAERVGGMDAAAADELWTQIEEFGAYGFNKSHAAAYSAISYWCQWLKVRHPVEFFCALLANESDTAKAGVYIREAARRGVKILPPEINVSGESWTPRGSSLVAGFSAVKKVGERACQSLVEVQPVKDLPDFLTRVNRRTVNKGVLEALAKAGAFRPFAPNTSWLLDNLEAILKRVGRKGWVDALNEQLLASALEPGFSERDAAAVRLEVGVTTGAHPAEVVTDLLEDALRVGFTSFAGAKDGAWCVGVVSGFKVGTARGERWAAAELEDADGDRLKLRFNDLEYRRHLPVLSGGVGTLVGVNLAINKFGGVRAAVLVDLLALRRRWKDGDVFAPEELAFFGLMHPVRAHRAEVRSDWWRERTGHPVLVLGVNVRRDKNNRLFAFVRVDPGVGRTREVVVFSDLYGESKGFMKKGSVVVMTGKKDERGGVVATSIYRIKE